MPRTPTTPTLTLCDNLVTYLGTLWGPISPNRARRAYLHRFDLSKSGPDREVTFFPVGYTNNPATRGFDFYEHTLIALTTRQYTDAADPDEVVPQEWVDAEVDFVNTYIVEGLDFTHDTTFGGTAPFNRNLQTLVADAPEMYDPEKLLKKEFWCAVELKFRELILS